MPSASADDDVDVARPLAPTIVIVCPGRSRSIVRSGHRGGAMAEQHDLAGFVQGGALRVPPDAAPGQGGVVDADVHRNVAAHLPREQLDRHRPDVHPRWSAGGDRRGGEEQRDEDDEHVARRRWLPRPTITGHCGAVPQPSEPPPTGVEQRPSSSTLEDRVSDGRPAGPASTPIPQPSGGHVKFKKGETVIYPQHGACIVRGRRRRPCSVRPRSTWSCGPSSAR